MLEIYNKRRNFEMSKVVLNLNQKYGYSQIVLGVSFLIAAACYVITDEILNLIGSVVHLVCSAGAVTALLLKSEPDDERSDKNLRRAGNTALLYLLSFTLVISMLTIVYKDLVIDAKILTRLVLGIGYLLYGYFFLKYEKEGY